MNENQPKIETESASMKSYTPLQISTIQKNAKRLNNIVAAINNQQKEVKSRGNKCAQKKKEIEEIGNRIGNFYCTPEDEDDAQ